VLWELKALSTLAIADFGDYSRIRWLSPPKSVASVNRALVIQIQKKRENRWCDKQYCRYLPMVTPLIRS